MLRQLRITVDGHEYDVTVEDLTDTGNSLYPQPGSMSVPAVTPSVAPAPAPAAAAPAAPAASAASLPAGGGVVAPMSGVIVEVLAKVGQQVATGDTVAVIEAMKMKTPISAEQGGTVASVEVAVGDGVQVGQSIVTFG